MTERRLPVQQLIILSICRFAEPIALTSVFPYVPEMMESFGVPENDIARWTGIASAIFSLSQGVTALFWGAASDRYGRKPIILLGLLNTMLTMLMWGFSITLPMALAARVLQGLGNGNVGILRTTVAELCPWKELQPRAFSIMPLVYTVGAIIGPMLGGGLSNPLGVDPHKPRGDAFFERFPYALPNIAAAVFFTVGIVVGWLFLKETLASKKHQQDLGLRTSAKITAFVHSIVGMPKRQESTQGEREPLIGQLKTPNGETDRDSGVASDVAEESPKLRDVLTYQTTLNLVVYTLLATYILGYDQMLPVFLHHPRQPLDDPNVKLPLKFTGGFGIDSRRIGAMFTFFAVSSTLWQFLLFPPIARYLGVLRCLRIAFLIFPFVYFVTPFLSLIPDPQTREVAMIVVLMIRGVGGTFAFPCSTIMLTNSASSLRVLGTINGLATSVSAVGRAIGPAATGGLFSWGLKRGYVIIPFWALSALALVASIPTWWLVDGKGFGDDPDSDEESIEPFAQDEDEAQNTEYPRIVTDDAAPSESDFGEPANLLSITSTRSSAAMYSDDEMDDEDRLLERRRGSNALGMARSHSQPRRRRSSVPIGMGRGFRRLSSNLGSTGVGAAGTSWGGT